MTSSMILKLKLWERVLRAGVSLLSLSSVVPEGTISGGVLSLATLGCGLPLSTLGDCTVVLMAFVSSRSSQPSLVELKMSVDALRWSIPLLTSGGGDTSTQCTGEFLGCIHNSIACCDGRICDVLVFEFYSV